MWLENRLELIKAHDGPVFLVGPEAFGVARLIAALKHERRPLIWLELEPADAGDLEGQSHKLYEAVKEGCGHALYPRALPLEPATKVISAYQSVLGPLYVALSGADHGPDLATLLFTLQTGGSQVLLAFERPDALPDFVRRPDSRALILDEPSLRLTLREALAVASNTSDTDVASLLEANGGAYEPLYAALCAEQGLPAPLIPSPNGARVGPGDALHVAPETLLRTLVAESDWFRALEVAVYYCPDQISPILLEAGPHARAQGRYGRLRKLLDRIPHAYQDETVLFWTLSSSWRLNRYGDVKTRVEAYLAKHEAAELRALYADLFLTGEAAGAELERALGQAKTPLTTYLRARQLSDPEAAVARLRQALHCAEMSGQPYHIVRAAGALACRLTHLGCYKEASYWGQWALALYDRSELADLPRRLHLVNEWAYARIFAGDLTGLGTLLREHESQLASLFPMLQDMFRGTLGDYHLVSGKPEQAIACYRETWRNAPRHLIGVTSLAYSKALLDVGDAETAHHVAHQAFELTRDLEPRYHLPARLAYGLVLTSSDRQAAILHLRAVLEQPELRAWQRAQASLYLARSYADAGDLVSARQVLTGSSASFKDMATSGLRLLSGPEEVFRPVWDMVSDNSTPLDLRFLGGWEVWYDNEHYELSKQRKECLALLACHPSGMSAEQLTLALYGERGTTNALYGVIKQLRQWLPIDSHPYRIGAPVRADFLELKRLLNQGRLREALAHYQGHLLPGAEAPGVLALRAELEEALRQAVLMSDDPNLLLAVLEHDDDDLELSEAALKRLPPGDPRLPLCLTRVRRLREEYGVGS